MAPGRNLASLASCLLLLALLAAPGGTQAQAEPAAEPASKARYTVVCSRILQPGRDFRVGVALLTRAPGRGIQRVSVRVGTVSKGNDFDELSARSDWESDSTDRAVTSKDLTISVPGRPNKFDLSGNYNLSVTIEDTQGNVYSNSTEISLSESPTVSLIQTDKAIYKPGQLVKFRIVNLDETIKPVSVSMEVLIKDAKGNLVDKQLHNPDDLASQEKQLVMTGQFRLSDMPNEGDWSITANSELFTETKTFTVRQYVLPKFTLELSVPSFVHVNDSEFTVRTKVQYTYEKAVEGEISVTMGPYMNCRSCKNKYDMLQTFTSDSAPDGETSFTFNLTSWREHLRSIGYTDRPYNYMAKASVQFKEKFTGEVKLVEKTFTIYTKSYELKIDTSQTAFFLPGFSVPVQMTLMRPDDKPFTAAAASNASATIVYHRRGKKQTMQFFNGPLSPSPTGTGASLLVRIPVDADFYPVRIEVKIDSDDSSKLHGTSTIYPYIGVTDDYVKVSKRILRDDSVEVDVEKTSGISLVYYAVLSRGQIQRWGRFADGAGAKVRFAKADLDSFVSDVTLVAFGFDRSGEIVASVVKHSTARLGGQIELSSNLTDNRGEPQQGAVVSVRAAPDSFVFLTGIDASVNLLATGQDILQSTLTEQYNSRISGLRYWPRPQKLTTARILQENGLILLSDAFYYADDNSMDYMYGQARNRKLMGASAEMAPAPPMAIRGQDSSGSGKTQVRKFFPETMIWTLVQADSEGLARHSFVLPDTITSWDVTGFGVAVDRPFQTMDSAFKLTTFKNFFIRPVLPYSLVRGEKFLLKVLAFNYRAIAGSVEVAVNVTRPALQLPSQTVSLEANSVGLAVFELTPSSLPSLDVTIRATWTGESSSETDVVVKSIIVIPEGKTVYRSRSVLLTAPANSSSDSAQQEITVEFPPEDSPDLVAGSEVFSYSVIGDVTGPAMQNIGGLLRLPSGCGEQNMVNFAPAVFIWEYLTATRQDTDPDVSKKALQVMKVGLQRQLTYKRLDGSYSAFGQQDEAGSAWLTAFVLSIYSKAAAFITVGSDSLTGQSVSFLLSRQSVNGQFSELSAARILDPGLQGSSGSASHGLTAFICMSLMDVEEAAIRWPKLQSTTWKDTDTRGAITKCLWFLKSAFESSPAEFSSYDAALSAYLLKRAQASTRYRQASLERGLQALTTALSEKAETDSNGGKYWSTSNRWGRRRGSVEATGWALIGCSMKSDATEECLQILRWLSDQQNSLGGFSSSQATVVGIRAIAAFATSSGLTGGDASVALNWGDISFLNIIEDSNRRVLQQSDLLRGTTARVGQVQARHTGEGAGFALAKLSWQYNILDRQQLTASDWKSSNGLSIRLGLMPPKLPPKSQHRLAVCAKANTTVSGEGMLILRVTNPSGYSAGRLPEPSSVAGLKRVEAGSQEVVMYFDYLPNDGACVSLQWSRDVPVLKLSPQQISLQMYYNADRIVSASYLSPELQELTRCTACPECPDCSTLSPDTAEEPGQPAWLNWLV
ncbi:hypothetical protein BOX15_Mlig006368g1 [Macrostomum lignano]|uniref:Uncharacterized protein n=1 Tax=Macrostomum lignano TaxID=282301 RepID=A0A267EYX9_9PLAT|nr:hypothetical protein BOX15_Mlig006368g1 [Macrostomum lignano]